MKRIILISVLCMIAVWCSGCGVLLGGIIGYQSGELLAGAAIGAGLQYGGGIVNGIGEATSNPVNDVAKAEIDSATGKIELPRWAFTSPQLGCLTKEYQTIFDKNQWIWRVVEKKTKSNKAEFREKWACKTNDGIEFEMTIVRQRHGKPSITIDKVSEGDLSRSDITIQIFDWLSTAVKRKCR